MTFSSHLACIKNKALQLKDQVQLTKLLIIRKDVARPSAQLAVVLLLYYSVGAPKIAPMETYSA